ncbi:hypothetical protein CANARDRAFT_205036, partial [[Candida] arabinofermentans NRRL YB-2248]
LTGNLSEWLRRKIRNLLGFARAGSNPAVVVFFLNFAVHGYDENIIISNNNVTN